MWGIISPPEAVGEAGVGGGHADWQPWRMPIDPPIRSQLEVVRVTAFYVTGPLASRLLGLPAHPELPPWSLSCLGAAVVSPGLWPPGAVVQLQEDADVSGIEVSLRLLPRNLLDGKTLIDSHSLV